MPANANKGALVLAVERKPTAFCEPDEGKPARWHWLDIANGKKPTIALPVSPDSLPIGDLGKLLSFK